MHFKKLSHSNKTSKIFHSWKANTWELFKASKNGTTGKSSWRHTS